jgi:putative nucleotidyltransferase with HDIG domain
MIEITHTIDKMKPFLSLNSAFIKINDLINENKLSNENGLRYIAKDPLMSTIMISTACNSVGSSKINTLKKAIEILGEDSVKNVFSKSLLNETFQESKKDENEDFWLHNLGVAIISKVICENTIYYSKSEELYFAGLLHDLGSYVIKQYFKNDYVIINNLVKADKQKRLLLAEKKVLGVTHQEIGTFYAKKIGLPKSIINVIRHHHYVDSSMEDKYQIAIVMIANNLAKGMKIGSTDNFYIELIPNWVWRYLQIDQTKYYEIVATIQDRFEVATAFTK